ncbi:hypothetical protein GW17_00046803 [Ensete ventricosum]|nr:hypothetical protein GW17_00046803 [Ensete ventricosum]
MCASSSALVEKGMELGGGRWRTLLSSIRANDDRSKIHLGSAKGSYTKASSRWGAQCDPSNDQISTPTEMVSDIQSITPAPGRPCLRQVDRDCVRSTSERLGSLARTVASSPEVGGSRVHSKSKELAVSSGELKQPTFRCPKSMKELCGTSVQKDDEGYYALHMIDLSPWDLDSEM